MDTKPTQSQNDIASERPNRRGLLAAGLGLAAVGSLAELTHADASPGQSPTQTESAAKLEKELLQLSKDKWQWMSERKEDALASLFHDKSVFVHMGGSMSRKQELDVVRSGAIQYKTIEIKESSVRIIDKTAIVLSTIRLTAVVGGNEVVNPFVVTEVYVQWGNAWKLGSLSFTRTLGN